MADSKSKSDLRSTLRRAASSTPERPKIPMRHPDTPAATAADKYSERINVYLSPEMVTALKMAQVEDKISLSARLRGMIEFWMEGRPKPDPDNPGQMTAPKRETRAIDLRAKKHRG